MDEPDAYRAAFIEPRQPVGLISFDHLDTNVADLPVTRRVSAEPIQRANPCG